LQAASGRSLQGVSGRSLQDDDGSPVLLRDVTDSLVNESIVQLVLDFTEMHSVFDFLRSGDSTILTQRLRDDWAEYTASAVSTQRSWPKLTETSPVTDRQMHWADVRNALGARIRPLKDGPTDLAKYFDESRERYDNTFSGLFADTMPHEERPNVYSHQIVQDDFAPKEKDFWDAST
jgi:hypothetical protein